MNIEKGSSGDVGKINLLIRVKISGGSREILIIVENTIRLQLKGLFVNIFYAKCEH
jgi:hypothetical protein